MWRVVTVRLYRGETHRLKELLAQYQAQANECLANAREQENEILAMKNAKPANDKEVKRWEKKREDEEQKLTKIKNKEAYYLAHHNWLIERFPNGIYEDVTGLCKAATLAELEEQDYSLNPGRYVGVVIEEDGLTIDEFLTEMQERQKTLTNLKNKASELDLVIENNLSTIIATPRERR